MESRSTLKTHWETIKSIIFNLYFAIWPSRCLPDPDGAFEWCQPTLRDMGHGRARTIPQRHPSLLQRSPCCHPGLWYQQEGKRNRHVHMINDSLAFLGWFCIYLIIACARVAVGNICQSSGVAQRAWETGHPRIHCPVAGGQQGGSGWGEAGLSAGTHKDNNTINGITINPHLYSHTISNSSVVTQEGQGLASDRGLYFSETSAMSGFQVSELLAAIGK